MKTRIFVEAVLDAFHTDPILDEGRHRHAWRVRLYFEARPFRDGRALQKALEEYLAPFQGRDLHPEMWATESLAETILLTLGTGDPIGCVASRDDGPGAEVWL